MVALLPGLGARLDSTECAVVAARTLRLEPPAAKPFGRGAALLGIARIRPIERRFPRCGIPLSSARLPPAHRQPHGNGWSAPYWSKELPSGDRNRAPRYPCLGKPRPHGNH